MLSDRTSKKISEAAILTFVGEAKDGKFGVISTNSSQATRVEARREEAPAPVYYYSYR